MAKNLSTLYPGKITTDANNPNGTFKNRTSDALKDGTPYEYGWASDVWGFLSHILGLGGVSPNGAEENETTSQYYDTLEDLVGRRKVEFETSSDLVMNYTSNTTAQATFSRMSLLDSNYIPKFLNNKTLTWTMPTNLEAGTSEKASTTYGCWVDSDENVVLAPDIEGTCTSTVSGFLVDNTKTLLTDKIHEGDILYNLTTKVKTTASADAAAEDRVAATANIFSSGDLYKIVKMSPVGLGEWRERLGSVYNNSGSNFDNQYYTQIQEAKTYPAEVTSANWTTNNNSYITVRQVLDWTGKGEWEPYFSLRGSFSSGSSTNFDLVVSGVIFQTGTNQAVTVTNSGHTGYGTSYVAQAIGASNTIQCMLDISKTLVNFWSFSQVLRVDSKPTFHN